MTPRSFVLLALVMFGGQIVAAGPARSYVPVSEAMLAAPNPADWLMYSRTYDAQRFSPLDQVNTRNVGSLALAWSRGLPPGVTETIPIVHDGVMYVLVPGAVIQALDAATGDLIWEYKRPMENETLAQQSRSKALAIYADMIYFTAPDAYVVALDARTGALRWETQTDQRGHTSAPLVIEGKVISGGACFGARINCYLAAHDALTGKELWRFYTTPAPGEPGDASWHGADLNDRRASTWGLPGSYDPVRHLIYWGIANAMPDLRMDRHGGNADGTGRSAPADLYSNSTVALNPDDGSLVWYYQHLPGDDADLDHTHERTLVHTRLNPDPAKVKWINPGIRKGEERDVAVMVSEGGQVFVNDAATGEFLWAMPFPYDTPQMLLGDINVETGATQINWDLVTKEREVPRTICYWNTRSYWPTAYHPGTNSLYTSYIDNCRYMSGKRGRDSWKVVAREGSDPDKLTGMAKIDLETGEILFFDQGRAPGNGAVLATAGDLVFHGDMSRRFKAFDARTGKQLWQSILGGNVSVSTITYAVDGKQYISVMTGNNLKVPELLEVVGGMDTPVDHTEIYTFALP